MTLALGRIVLTAGVVYSQRFPFSTTVIVDEGIIAWIGDEEGLSGQLLADDTVIDCQGAFIAPAFMDANAGVMRNLSAEVGAAFFRVEEQLVPYEFTRGAEPAAVRLKAPRATSRHDGILEQPISVAISEMLSRREIAVLPTTTEPTLLTELAQAGVPFAFGSFGADLDIWGAVRHAVYGGPGGISGRAAFNAATRAGWRILGAPEAGEAAVGSFARLNLWRCDDLVVQLPDDRIAAWSTDVRAGTPPLPDLSPDASLPTLWATMTGMQLSVIGE